MGPSSILNSKVLKHAAVVFMSRWAHALPDILYRSSARPVARSLWPATLRWTLQWPANTEFFGPEVLSSVNFWLPNVFVFVHLQVVIAVEAFRPEVSDCLVGGSARVSQHATLVEHTNHVPARLLVHDNMIAALVLFKQDFMRPPVGFSNVLHVVHSSAA